LDQSRELPAHTWPRGENNSILPSWNTPLPPAKLFFLIQHQKYLTARQHIHVPNEP
jgi:hypothetical protein